MANTRKYPRGRVAPPNLLDLIAKSHARHGARLKKLVTPTAPSFDWSALGKVPPVRDQGQCGSCWDFSGCGVATMAFGIAGLQPMDGTFDLSEQYVLDCGQNGGCNGDDNTTVLQQCQASGLVTDAYGPYTAQAGRCNQAELPRYKITSWGFADSNGGQGVTSTADIQEALVTYGPVGCAVAAGDDWDNYTSGEFAGAGNKQIDHDVMIVAWQPSTLQPGKVAWKVRNSWGKDWGMDGYMLLTEGGDQIGTETVWAEVGTTPPTPTPPAPTPPPPSAELLMQVMQELQAGNYILTPSSPSQRGPGAPGFKKLVLPSWLEAALNDLCDLAGNLPAPYAPWAEFACSMFLPATRKKCGGCK